MTNSYNGWPGITAGQTSRLTTIEPVPGRKFRVLAGDVAVIFDWLIRRYHNEVEPIDTGVLDDWSYNYRMVREGVVLSNHGSATAVDLNATRHPFKRSASQSMTPAQIARCRAIIADIKVDGRPVMRWIEVGDPMHWEVNYAARGGTPEAVAILAARIRGGAVPVPTVPPLVSTTPAAAAREPRVIEWRNPSEAFVKIVQAVAGVREDGIYGPRTRQAVRDVQRRVGIADDGIFGPGTARGYLARQGNIGKGDRGPAVQLVQWAVWATVDGVYGDATDAAVRSAQVWAGVAVDGIVGAHTRDRIIR